MSKEKVNIQHKFFGFLISHPWLKIISLLLAVIVWFYVKGEINLK